MTPEVKQLIEFATQDLIAEIVAVEGLAIQTAMSRLYHSSFFTQLQNPSFGLYRESGTYLYSAFKNSTAIGNQANSAHMMGTAAKYARPDRRPHEKYVFRNAMVIHSISEVKCERTR